MLDVAETFQAGWRHHQAGDLARAEQLYLQTLEADAQHVDAWHLLGAAYLMQGRTNEAVAALRRALTLNANHGPAHDNLGIALVRQGKVTEAIAQFQQAVRLKPDYAETHLNLAAALVQERRFEEAVTSYREALRLQPYHAEAHHRLARVLTHLGRRAEAVAAWQTTTTLDPRHFQAFSALGEALALLGQPQEAIASYRRAIELKPDHYPALMNLGCLLLDMKPEEALVLFERARQVRPDSAEAIVNVGFALVHVDRYEEAEATFRTALALRPDFADAHSGVGMALSKQERHEEAIVCHRQALALRPQYAEAFHNLGVSLGKLGHVEEAIAAHREAVRCQPNGPEPHGSLASNYLLLGRYPEGWREYEWRWRCRIFRGATRSFAQPLWDGGPLDGRTILLYTEQGLGDILQFIRYAPLVKARGGTVLVECPPAMHALLSRCLGIDRLLARGTPLPPFDVQAPLLSVPGIVGTTVDTIPADVPYLFVPDDLVEHWRRELQSIEGLKVGISWRGNARNPYDRYRSLRLEQLEPLAQVPGVRLINLQKGAGTAEELRQAAERVPVLDLGDRLDRESGAFLDSGAVMKNLDLVISADTAPAHLAGGLAVPFWVALPFAAEWRWLLDREDSPWYPTARLFRQPRPGDWGTVIARMAQALRTLARA
jgi:tetratricopeptide (TPR) repeat protein